MLSGLHTPAGGGVKNLKKKKQNQHPPADRSFIYLSPEPWLCVCRELFLISSLTGNNVWRKGDHKAGSQIYKGVCVMEKMKLYAFPAQTSKVVKAKAILLLNSFKYFYMSLTVIIS